jgi:plasmid stabilization system protein ParE
MDLQNVYKFIAEDSPYYAMTFFEDVMDKAHTLMYFPHRGRIVPELDNPNVREIFLHKYRLIYRVQDWGVEIVTLIHGAMDFKGQL